MTKKKFKNCFKILKNNIIKEKKQKLQETFQMNAVFSFNINNNNKIKIVLEHWLINISFGEQTIKNTDFNEYNQTN